MTERAVLATSSADTLACDVCGRPMRVAAACGEAVNGMLRCDHDGPCPGHPEGEACQYYYLAFGVGAMCGLRYMPGKMPTRVQIEKALAR